MTYNDRTAAIADLLLETNRADLLAHLLVIDSKAKGADALKRAIMEQAE